MPVTALNECTDCLVMLEFCNLLFLSARRWPCSLVASRLPTNLRIVQFCPPTHLIPRHFSTRVISSVPSSAPHIHRSNIRHNQRRWAQFVESHSEAKTQIDETAKLSDKRPINEGQASIPTADSFSRTQAVLVPVIALVDRSKATFQNSAANAYDHMANTLLPKVTELLNTLTGYSVVQECKSRVLEKDAELSSSRERCDAAKQSYEITIEARRKCQRELNSLLQVDKQLQISSVP